MYRQIHTSIWSEPWFEPLSASAKLLFLYLCLCDQTQPCGAWHGSYRRITFEAGLATDQIEPALAELAEKVERFSNTGELVLWIRRFAHWQDKGGNWQQAVKKSLTHQCPEIQTAFSTEYPSIPVACVSTGRDTQAIPSIPSLAVSVSVSEHSTQNHSISTQKPTAAPKKRAALPQLSPEAILKVKDDSEWWQKKKSEHPNLDLDRELELCQNWLMQNPDKNFSVPKAKFGTWLITAEDIAKNHLPTRSGPANRVPETYTKPEDL